MALPFDPSCDLCEAARLSEWHHEDDVCWVADCEVCGVPMVVWKHHGPTPPDDDVEHMLAQLTRVADARFGAGRVVGRPGHAPDPGPLPRPRAGPELVVPPARHALTTDPSASLQGRRPAVRQPKLAPVGWAKWRLPRSSAPTRSSTRSPIPAAAPWARWGDGSVETNWFVLLHRRVSARAVRSPRYQWWALVALLAGLLSLNITFTVFVVALPTVKADFHTNFSVLAWASTGPLLAFGVAAPFFGKAGDLFGHRRLYQFGLLGAMVSAILTATAPDVGMLLFARCPRRRAGRRHRHGVDGDHPRAVRARGPGEGARVVVAGRAPAGPSSA